MSSYASLRLRHAGHKFRYGHGPLLVEAGQEQTITFKAAPFPHFEVQPGGFQIPLDNVATAVPIGASLASKMRRTTGTRTKAAKEAEAKGERDG